VIIFFENSSECTGSSVS